MITNTTIPLVKSYVHKDETGKTVFTYVKLSELSKEEREDFENFMRGQTVPLLPEEGDIAYSWDYENFKAQGKLFWD